MRLAPEWTAKPKPRLPPWGTPKVVRELKVVADEIAASDAFLVL
jgi:hypothetical protein